jgi:hypothetical protein
LTGKPTHVFLSQKLMQDWAIGFGGVFYKRGASKDRAIVGSVSPADYGQVICIGTNGERKRNPLPWYSRYTSEGGVYCYAWLLDAVLIFFDDSDRCVDILEGGT